MPLNVENVLQIINKEYVSLKNPEVSKAKADLEKCLDQMIFFMKKDTLFKTLFEKTFYGGSVYDGLKIEKPNEFDMDLLLVLPKVCETHQSEDCGCVEMIPSNKPGFFWFKVKKDFYSPFNKFIKDDYVQTDLVINWLQSVVCKVLNVEDIGLRFGRPILKSQSGPALVLEIVSEIGQINIDLVPSFKFGSTHWPKGNYRENTTTKTDFCIVPKKLKLILHGERYWRASFQAQERELISGKEKLKPALRLLKKMRNNLGHVSIFSYALKTIVLWNLETWKTSSTLTEVFLGLLEKYQDCRREETLYFWNKKLNLLEEVKPITLENHKNEIKQKKEHFVKNMDNPLEIAKIILKEGSKEYLQFMKDYGNERNNVCEVNGNQTVFQVQRLLNVQRDSDERERRSTQTDQTSNGQLIATGLAVAIIGGITIWRYLNVRNNQR
ncbi:cyclic GMP-AMP synthase-like receptor [Euwallacea fornicatus]|uniref:cyclic GMP-AMP synthase-like receptor n=1 Tax=Euwallacea fornicatus TaxID=995702 RepID=UPI00338FC960